MSVDHYENFPVASLLLPAALRRPVSVIYRFARSADDFADEGNLTPEARLTLLDGYRGMLAVALAALTVATLLKLIPPAATKVAIDYVLLKNP